MKHATLPRLQSRQEALPRFRPRLEALEDRALPNNFFTPWSGFGVDLLSPSHKHDDEQLAAAVSSADARNPGVIPREDHPYGYSYAEWSARWWQYALSIDADHSPFFDLTGANFAVGQSGPVWFLSGVIVFTPTGGTLPPGEVNTVVRYVTLPSDTALFFPVLNTETDNLKPGDTNTTFSVGQLRHFAQQQMAMAENMQAQVDGRSIVDLSHYDVKSPVFSYDLPENNIVTVLSGTNVPKQTVDPVVGDGVYVMLRPLPVGQHTVHFAGDFGPGNFALDVTYHITVTPGH